MEKVASFGELNPIEGNDKVKMHTTFFDEELDFLLWHLLVIYADVAMTESCARGLPMIQRGFVVRTRWRASLRSLGLEKSQ